MDENFNLLLDRAKPLVKSSKAWDIVSSKFGLISVYVAGEYKDTGEVIYGAKSLNSYVDLLLDVFIEVEAIVRESFPEETCSEDFINTFRTFASHYTKGLPNEKFALFALEDYIRRNLLEL